MLERESTKLKIIRDRSRDLINAWYVGHLSCSLWPWGGQHEETEEANQLMQPIKSPMLSTTHSTPSDETSKCCHQRADIIEWVWMLRQATVKRSSSQSKDSNILWAKWASDIPHAEAAIPATSTETVRQKARAYRANGRTRLMAKEWSAVRVFEENYAISKSAAECPRRKSNFPAGAPKWHPILRTTA